MKQWILLSSLLAVSVVRSPAEILTFIASGPVAPGLSGLNENAPHPESAGAGSALITWDTATHTMTVNVVFTGLTTPNTAAHIHCCVAPPGNTSVATTVPTFTGFPGGVTAGTYSHSFNMQDAASYNPTFITSHGGTVATAEAALLAGIRAGQSYLNIHTMRFTGGEIRGFLVQPVTVSVKDESSGAAVINPRSRGKIPVTILSTATFNALTGIDTNTLTFGRTGNEQSLAFCSGGDDVNGDGLADLVCHFNTQDTGIQSGDTIAYLKGMTLSGTPIFGQDSIRTVP